MPFLYNPPYLPFRLILQSLESFYPSRTRRSGGTLPVLPFPSWFDRPGAFSTTSTSDLMAGPLSGLWRRGGHTAHRLLPACLQEVGKGPPAML